MSQNTARKRRASTNGKVEEPPSLELTKVVLVLCGVVRDSKGIVVNEVQTEPMPLYGADLDRIAPGVRTELWPNVRVDETPPERP